MTPESQRIAIAEACGWKAREDEDGFWRAVEPIHGMRPDKWMSERNVWSAGIPDYLHDLNACHEMEKVLTEREQLAYIEEIGKLVRDAYSKTGRDPRSCEDREVIFWHMTATATQRCEAFLRTLGLWREPSS